MLVRIFANANTENRAREVYRKFIDIAKPFIKDEKIAKVEPYWKYDDMYVIETNILLTCNIGSKQFEEFLYIISDKWQFFGIPVNEALASSNTEGCKYIVDMVNIFY